LLLAAAVAGSGELAAQVEDPPPEEGGITQSLGQPPRLKWYGGFGLGMYLDGDEETFLGLLELRAFKNIGSPVAGMLGVSAEAYGGLRRDSLDGGFRVLGESPYLGTAVGADYNIRDNAVDALISFFLPPGRGGLFGTGGLLRINWYPWKGHTFTVGFSFPLRQRSIGRSRPRHDRVVVAQKQPEQVPYAAVEPVVDSSLQLVRESAHWINRFTTPFFDQDGKDHADAMANFAAVVDEYEDRIAVRSFEDEVLRYHAELDRLFSLAAGETELPDGASTALGREIAAEAKGILLEHVIFPYNRLLGQKKKNDTILALGTAARGLFARWIVARAAVPLERKDAVLYAFQELIDIFEENREYSKRTWSDPRLAWIPLQYALRPEQHDSQAELDRIIERAVGNEFTDGNMAWYIVNTQFQWELWRMIREAEDYHVLWIHDFPGNNAAGDPDQVAFVQVWDAYFAALTERVRRYDETGKLPSYFIFLDQHYYELRKSRRWMSLLQDPLRHEMSFPGGFEWMGDSIAAAQERLREAVAGSALLQAEARQYGEDWLYNRIKVHVNITNQADRSFWSGRTLGFMFGYPDNIMRDHRKISFYDLTETDPYKGMAIYTGMGVGEGYIGAGWEDRAMLAQGPAVVHLKQAARELLRNQGFEEHEIPVPLRAQPMVPRYDEIVADTVRSRRFTARAMELHNQTGYQYKAINVFKATLYSLAPPGTIMKVPDSLWNSPFFSALLVGACLRGAQVMIVNPAAENAPSSGFPQMSRAYELMARLVVIQQELGDEISAAGGMLRTGLYHLDVDVRDVVGRTRALAEGLDDNPWLRELLGFTPSLVADLLDLVAEMEARGFSWSADSGVARPKLHGKMQFFAWGEALRGLLGAAEWGPIFREYARYRIPQMMQDTVYVDPTVAPAELARQVEAVWDESQAALTPEQREHGLYYLIVGSQNQDYRGMFMDGEVGYLVSGPDALDAVFDMTFIFGASTWVDTIEELDALLPPYSEFQRRVGRMIKEAL
jgi:hypothetical protein